MSSEYIRQLEEANTKLSTMIEKMDDRCQWLEKLRQMRVKSSWDLSTKNQIGINNYKTKTIVGQKDVYEQYKFKNCDKKINHALAELDYSSIQKNCVSLNSANKDVIRIGYKTWKNVFPAFISHSNYMLSLKKYSFIEKISLTTSIELYLQTYGYLGTRCNIFCTPYKRIYCTGSNGDCEKG